MIRIAGIVVTYNRKELLIKNIESSLNQTRKLDMLYVIDNASTDGTFEFLRDNNLLDSPNLKFVQLEKNIGGAGGFYEGLKLAYDHGFDYFWLMDDDGCPRENCLNELLQGMNLKFDITGPLIESDIDGLAHSEYSNSKCKTENLEEIKKEYLAYPVHPFNGTLISRKVVDSIGLPIKDLFIWGDEQEYRLRWLKNGFKEASITTALYYHPRNKLQFNKFFIFKTPKISENRKYLFFRNQTFIFKKYRNWAYFSASLIWMILNIIFFEKNKFQAIDGIKDGLRGDLSDHKMF